MNKKIFLIFGAIIPAFLSIAITFSLFLSTDDLSLTGIARSDFYLLFPIPAAQNITNLQKKDDLPPPSEAPDRKLYIYENDPSQGEVDLITM